MKTLFNFSLLFLSFSTIAAKPELVLRYSDNDAWRLPAGQFCFNNTPVSYLGDIYLRCGDGEVEKLFKISNSQVSAVFQSENGYKISDPILAPEGLIWSEYAEGGTRGIYRLHQQQVQKINYKPQGMIDGLAQVGEDKYIFRWRNFDGDQFVTSWKNIGEQWNDHPERAFAFTPFATQGQLAYKIRLNTLDEKSPDLLYWWKDLHSAPLVLSDKDADATSVWQSFRNTVALSGSSMIFMGRLKDGSDALAMMNLEGKVEILAQTGMEGPKELDYFSPSINKKQMIIFRGVTQDGARALFLWRYGRLTTILRQGDVVHTDKGIARIDYSNPTAIFMSAPYIDESKVLVQTALVDIDDPKTLIGVGLIQINLDPDVIARK